MCGSLSCRSVTAMPAYNLASPCRRAAFSRSAQPILSHGVAVLTLNLNQLLDPSCPYVASIDGLPLERWLEAAARHVARGSPQLIRRRSLEWLGEVGFLREELGLPPSEIVNIGLRSAG